MIQTLLDLDKNLLLTLHTLIPPTWAPLVKILGESIVIFWALILLGIWIQGVRKKENSYKVIALQIFFTIILTFVFYTVINFWLPKWRPGGMEITGATALIPHPIDNSFPSGHALFTAALIVGLSRFWRYRPIIILAFVFWVITGLSRVIGWVHYPWDILAGWLFGGIFALFTSRLVKHIFFEKYIFPFFIRLASVFHL